LELLDYQAELAIQVLQGFRAHEVILALEDPLALLDW